MGTTKQDNSANGPIVLTQLDAPMFKERLNTEGGPVPQ